MYWEAKKENPERVKDMWMGAFLSVIGEEYRGLWDYPRKTQRVVSGKPPEKCAREPLYIRILSGRSFDGREILVLLITRSDFLGSEFQCWSLAFRGLALNW